MAEGMTICCACVAFVLVPSIILIMLSFATLEPVEYGLNFNAITMSLENETYSQAGLYFLGFGHWFIRFPRVIQTIEFMATGENSLLHTRTADGLPLTLGLSFQYRYLPQHLYTLYLTYKGDHHSVYVNTATATIANIACNYSAYTFFNDKQGIAIAMRNSLNEKFVDKLYAQVDALQINQVELPSSFQEAILESISTKQNITRSMRFKENMQVTFSTQRMVASQEANQTVIVAHGVANQKLQQASANAQMTQQTVAAEIAAYSNLSHVLSFGSSDSLDYLWWDTLQSAAVRDDARGKEFLVGLDPAAYIKGGPAARASH
mmetsp:Transcript_40013/g.105764  ORF Transcript_40013/g.105764 Transcript_40013/m.105764 type:complete len:320 (+) Transcript_40013:152-1111(+)|eukprot:CAMPEP_0115867946 /NCGR_PEP_ID=MMETSP0287-20121206/21029_1 /TAXON_ID=412157 /ORGANISM="Chrysochromulina rotalis, Strain UIO044" /LENGTH=319 /DNA_ID=CAMNT_0003322565 /DNA_START=138 /DNA_END=1097 /DNA_ORIENTATION=-